MTSPKNETKPQAAPIVGAAELNETELDKVAGGAEALALNFRGSRPVGRAGDGSVRPGQSYFTEVSGLGGETE